MRSVIFLFCSITLAAEPVEEIPKERVRVSLERMMARAEQEKDLLHQRRQHKRDFDADGKMKSETVVTLRRDPWEEQIVTRTIAKNDQPLSAEEAAKQEERLRKQVEVMRKNPPKPRSESEASWMRELPEALKFRKVGTELRNGRQTDVLEFEPHPDYKAKQFRAKVFERIRGKVWLDQADGELAKLDVLVFDSISMGFGILGRLDKGTHFELERKKWDIGVWFEEWQRVRFDVRILLIKSVRQEIETRWSNLSFRPGR